MKTFYFYFNDEANCNNEIIIIKASDEKQAKQKLINIYFKGLSKWSYNDIISYRMCIIFEFNCRNIIEACLYRKSKII